jgi:hypothetical protein
MNRGSRCARKGGRPHVLPSTGGLLMRWGGRLHAARYSDFRLCLAHRPAFRDGVPVAGAMAAAGSRPQRHGLIRPGHRSQGSRATCQLRSPFRVRTSGPDLPRRPVRRIPAESACPGPICRPLRRSPNPTPPPHHVPSLAASRSSAGPRVGSRLDHEHDHFSANRVVPEICGHGDLKQARDTQDWRMAGPRAHPEIRAMQLAAPAHAREDLAQLKTGRM